MKRKTKAAGRLYKEKMWAVIRKSGLLAPELFDRRDSALRIAIENNTFYREPGYFRVIRVEVKELRGAKGKIK